MLEFKEKNQGLESCVMGIENYIKYKLFIYVALLLLVVI